MKRSKVFSTVLALALVAVMGAAGTALAYPHHTGGASNLTQEQQTAIQEVYAKHNEAVAPLLQQLAAKRAELNSLSYSKTPDSGKVQTLYKEISAIEAKRFEADVSLRNSLSDKGIPAGGYGMHMGYGGGHGGRHGGGHW